jgi:hypothetical protein
MANPYTVGWGLRPARGYGASAGNFQLQKVQIAYNNSHSFGQGDLVIGLSTGYIDYFTTGGNGNTVAGVFWGCKYFNPAINRMDWYKAWTAPSGLASTQVVEAWVYNDPMMEFEILGSTAAAVAQGDVGANADILTGTDHNPNSTTGISTGLLDQATINTTSTFPLRIVGLAEWPNVSNALASNIVRVKLNGTALLGLTGI